MTALHYSPSIIHADLTKASKPDAKGYYLMNAGAFNTHNRNGDFYPLTESVKRLFSSNSKLMRRIDERQLYGEWDHPKPKPGMKYDEWLARVCSYDMDRIASFTSKVMLVDGVDDQKRPVKLCQHRIRPYGPMGSYFGDAMSDDEMNPALSVRSITTDRLMETGNWRKEIDSIWNWDVVDVQGIAVADKMRTSTALESLELTPEMIASAIKTNANVGLESNQAMVRQVLTDLGWEEVRITKPNPVWMSNC